MTMAPGLLTAAAGDIFNAFYTTKQTGMGMGLAICRTIIRSHGGELRFRNNSDRNARSAGNAGATFFFTIPTQADS